MDDDNEYRTLRAWLCAACCALFIVFAIPAAVMSYDDTLIAEMVKNGADPISARCGIVGPTGLAPSIICSNYSKVTK